MIYAPDGAARPPGEIVPSELADLLDRVRDLPPSYREALLPSVAEAIEQARFRSRALVVAAEALERLRLDLELTRFDLDLTRIERQTLESRAG